MIRHDDRPLAPGEGGLLVIIRGEARIVRELCRPRSSSNTGGSIPINSKTEVDGADVRVEHRVLM